MLEAIKNKENGRVKKWNITKKITKEEESDYFQMIHT
nr:MAG: hypothetical protein [Bacteriophage sp.]